MGWDRKAGRKEEALPSACFAMELIRWVGAGTRVCGQWESRVAGAVAVLLFHLRQAGTEFVCFPALAVGTWRVGVGSSREDGPKGLRLPSEMVLVEGTSPLLGHGEQGLKEGRKAGGAGSCAPAAAARHGSR